MIQASCLCMWDPFCPLWSDAVRPYGPGLTCLYSLRFLALKRRVFEDGVVNLALPCCTYLYVRTQNRALFPLFCRGAVSLGAQRHKSFTRVPSPVGSSVARQLGQIVIWINLTTPYSYLARRAAHQERWERQLLEARLIRRRFTPLGRWLV
jgi:hypothetical protein